MELLYKNEYGASYKVDFGTNPECEVQLVIDTVGLFMSKEELDHLLTIVKNSHEPCDCGNCNGPCEKIWCTGPLVDICLKVSDTILDKMEDLIAGTQFMLNIDATLEGYRLK